MSNIKKGYKQTDIGVIPEDWVIVRLKDISTNMSYGVGASAISYNGKVKYIRITDIDENSRKFHPTPLSSPAFYSEIHKVNDGDVLFARTGASVGKSYLYNKADGNLIFAGFLIRLNIIGALPEIVFYNTLSKRYSDWVLSESTRTGQPGLNLEQYKNLLIPIPKELSEQTAIATALSDTDALIAALDKKIAKKQQIKQGAMQQLLTGKKRLSGFSGEWVEIVLGSVCEVKRGQMIVSSEFVKGPIPVIAGGMTPAGYHNLSNRNENTITISASGANAGFIGFHKSPIFASDCSTINENENIDIRFIYYTLKLKQEEIYNSQTGGAQPHIHPKDIEPLILNFPIDKSEQTAIAQILTDMDNEIAQLEKERDKYKEMKAGMMQELLTGKIRLI